MIVGRTVLGPATLELSADRVYLFDVGIGALAQSIVIGSLIARLDGLGAGNGEQRLRPVVMESGDPSTLALGDEVVVADGAAASWVHLTFDLPPTIGAGRTPLLGFAVGPVSGVGRLIGVADALIGQWFASPYGLPPDVSGAPTAAGVLPSLCACGVTPWLSPGVPDEQLAELPFAVAQSILGSTGPVGDPVDALCGWHYKPDDPPPHSSAIARSGGPLAELVGQRVRVTADVGTGARTVAVYIDDEQPFDDELADEDLSLARPAFAELAPLWTETLEVQVEVLT